MARRCCHPDEPTKTLVASLVSPTQHKREKLDTLETTATNALVDAFEQDADTQSAVNDIVTPYDLPYQVKDALKNHVPDLLDEETYDATELDTNQPVRFVNRAARFDYSDERTHGFCWRVPQPGRGSDFWVPLAINPDHADEWHDLTTDNTETRWSAGQLRLQRGETSAWELHVTVSKQVDGQADLDVVTAPTVSLEDADVTPVGFDVGEAHLLVGCAYEHGAPTDPLFVDGAATRQRRQTQASAEDRLKKRYADELLDEYVFGSMQRAIDDDVETASKQAVEYATDFENPCIVLEDLSGIDEEDIGAYWNRRLGKSVMRTLQSRIEAKALEQGIPVVYVNPHYTSKTCHACNRLGYRPHQGTFVCPHDDCWVSEYQADLNAAAKLAQKLNPWGESLLWKSAGDDSPRSGAPVTEPRDTLSSEDLPSERRASDEKVGASSSGGTGSSPETDGANAS